MPTASQLGTCKAFKKRQLTGAQVDMQPPFDAGAGLLILQESRGDTVLGPEEVSPPRNGENECHPRCTATCRPPDRWVGQVLATPVTLAPYTDFVSPLNKRILFNFLVRTQGLFGHGKPHSGLARA